MVIQVAVTHQDHPRAPESTRERPSVPGSIHDDSVDKDVFRPRKSLAKHKPMRQPVPPFPACCPVEIADDDELGCDTHPAAYP